MKDNFIAIENAADGASVALLQMHEEGAKIRYKASHTAGKNAEQVLPMLDGLLVEAGLSKQDIHGVAFSQGPGGFTGLRVACGLAQGLALGLQVPVVPVSSLEASAVLSQHFLEEGFIVVALDARMQEVYLAVYSLKNTRLHLVQEPVLMQSQDVIAWVTAQIPRWCLMHDYSLSGVRICLAGNAMEVYPEDFVLPNTQWLKGESKWANADTLVRLAYDKFKEGGVPLEELAPLYLRDKVAFTTVERESGMGGNPKIALPAFSPIEQEQYAFAEQLLAQKVWIRRMRRSDLAAVISIDAAAHYTPWTEGMFLAALMHIAYDNWVLVNEQNVVLGYAVQLTDPDVVHLMTIAVAPSLQGQGLGSLLLKWCELFIASNKNAPQRQLLEVRVSNEAARALYEKQAYQQIGLRKAYYEGVEGREDALVLQKEIGINSGESSV